MSSRVTSRASRLAKVLPWPDCGWPSNPRSPDTHIVGPWVIDSISSYRDHRTGTQYIGNWALRVTHSPTPRRSRLPSQSGEGFGRFWEVVLGS